MDARLKGKGRIPEEKEFLKSVVSGMERKDEPRRKK